MNHISGPCTDITSFEMMNCPAISPLSAALTTLLYALMPVGHEMPSPSAVHSTGTSVIPATDSDWFQPCFNGMICFTDHRIDFDSPDRRSRAISWPRPTCLRLGLRPD